MKARVLDFLKGFKKRMNNAPWARQPTHEVRVSIEIPKKDFENLRLAAQVYNRPMGDLIREAVQKITKDEDR